MENTGPTLDTRIQELTQLLQGKPHYVVVVFHNLVTRESTLVDQPVGNYRRNYHPLELVGEYAYDPTIPADRERALSQAQSHRDSLADQWGV